MRQAFHVGSALGAVLVAGMAGSAFAASDAATDRYFREANDYTVRVRAHVTDAFIEDDQGSWMGAGFLVDRDRGWIVTNAHVSGRSPGSVQVAFADGEYRPARKVYVDTFADIAILAVDGDLGPRRPALLRRLRPVTVGEPVGAYGHPLGMPFTATRGIVSALTDQFGVDLVQIDATVDHGNSGGPVISLRDGQVVGIATAGAGGSKADRLNFATPVTDVCRILDLLRAGIAPDPPQIGVGLLRDEDGRYTLRVGQNIDRERWPLEPGDRLIGPAGSATEFRTLGDLVRELRGADGVLPMVVERDGSRMRVAIRPERSASVLERRGVIVDGALIAPLEVRDASSLSQPIHLVVHSVALGSAAEEREVQEYDVIESVDGVRVETLDALNAQLAARREGESLHLVLRRFSGATNRVFEWYARELPGDEVRNIGPDAPVAAGH